MTEWYDRLKQLRKSRGMDQKGLALKSGLTQGIISGLENNKKKFTQNNLDAILGALNYSYSDLFSNEEKDNINSDNIMADCDEKTKELCKKVKEVMESKTHWAESLESNINSFKHGLDGDAERKEMREDISELKKSNADLYSERPKKPFGKKKTM